MMAVFDRRAAGAVTRVYVACGRCDEVPAGDAWLSPGERAVAATLRLPKRCSDWRLGRWIAKRAVIACLTPEGSAVEPPDVEILARDGGAPAARILAGPVAASVSVSISHSDGMGMAAAAIGPVALACDVERIGPRTDRFIADYFTAAEREQVARAVENDRAALVTLIWSAKEAALKVLGEGLRLDTRAVVVRWPDGSLPAAGRCAPVRVRVPAGPDVEGWCWVGGGFVWTVADDSGGLLLETTCAPLPGASPPPARAPGRPVRAG